LEKPGRFPQGLEERTTEAAEDTEVTEEKNQPQKNARISKEISALSAFFRS
jgi:hypothetical protein